MKSAIQASILLLAGATAASAGESYQSVNTSAAASYQAPSLSLYNAGEFQFDLFGAYAFASSDDRRLIRDDVFGGGVGFNYYFTRNFGIGLEGSLFDTDGDMLGTGAVNLIYRMPIGESGFAPYLFGGAGITFNADDLDSEDFEEARDRLDDDRDLRRGDDVIFLAHGGAGLEYRFNPNTSIFADARYTWSEKDDSDFGVVRAGARFSF